MYLHIYAEVSVEILNEADVELADALTGLSRAVSDGVEYRIRSWLAEVLDLTNPGWQEDEVIVNWVKEQGLVKASEMLLNRHLA